MASLVHCNCSLLWGFSGIRDAIRRRRRRLHLFSALLSSYVSRQDSWNTFVSNDQCRPISSMPYRSIACRSHFSLAGNAIEPTVEAAKFALTKFYNVLRHSSLVLKLVPAVGLLIFSLWGVVPLICQGRSLLFNKNDSSWKTSNTYHVMTSYIQPLLIWLGALYICRALDPIVLPTEASQVVKDRLLDFFRSLSMVLACAYCLSSAIQKTQKVFAETSDPRDTGNMGFQFAGKAVHSAVWIAAVSLLMELLGFSTQRWLTAGGLGTVLITLAGREIFTNFLSSVMIHATRPFVMNEWVQTKIEGYEVSGTVESFIRGEDREAVHIPNHKFTVNVVRNLSQKSHWRIKTHLAISHLDVNKINLIVADMQKVLAKNPQVEQQRLHRRVFLDNVDPENQALMILISCFVKTSHYEEYLCVKEAILLDLLRVIRYHRARLATPIRTIRKMHTDADMENNIPFGDSIYDHGGVAPKRPLLLIEPSYRINGEDKSKSQNPSPKPNGEQESKSSSSSKSKETPVLEPKVNVKSVETPSPGNKKVIDEVVASKSVSNPNPPKDSETSGADGAKINVSPNPKPPRNDGQIKPERADGLATSSRSAALEENIVLGVALEGSKRTLPIDEDTESSSSSSMAADAKELAGVGRNTNAPPLAGDKEKKDSQIQASTEQ